MRVGSLFAGIGGFDLAASRVWGWDCVRWQVEIDPWARRVLAKHWPDVPKHGDIRELTGDDIEPVDLVCGGFPCQPFSLAGKRMGAADERALWPEMLRVVSLVRPRWVVGENVPGLFNLGLDAVCADLEGAGYEVGTLGLPAVAVGAPHIRQRLWIVAYRCSERRQQVTGSSLGDESPNGRRAEVHHQLASDGQGRGPGFVAHSHRERELQPSGGLAYVGGRTGDSGEQVTLAYANGSHEHGRGCALQVVRHGSPGKAAADGLSRGTEWGAEPNVGRVAHGVPHRVDRLRGLGNAIVPAVAERLFRWIQEAEEQFNG